jgi:two-component system LytT family response regulator
MENNKLTIPTTFGFRFIDPYKIIYCKADRNYTSIFLVGGEKITTSLNLGKLEQPTQSFGIFRVHHSYLINLARVVEFHKGKPPWLVLSNGDSVKVSIQKREELLERLIGKTK